MISKYSKSSLLKSLTIAGVIASVLGVGNSLADKTENKQLEKNQQSEERFANLSDQELINLLMDEDFSTREKATEAVWRKGRPILNALTKALDSNSPELLYRAKNVINLIKIGLTPDTPSHITELVESFSSADENSKRKILNDLYKEQYYQLMLFLISRMDDQKLAGDLYNG